MKTRHSLGSIDLKTYAPRIIALGLLGIFLLLALARCWPQT
jgi:hypothetical protein